MRLLHALRDPSHRWSPARWARAKRFEMFRNLLDTIERPLSIVDVGGTPGFWRSFGLLPGNGVAITLANLYDQPSAVDEGFVVFVEDARTLAGFADDQFDIAYSNSVIEHVGGADDRMAMAAAIRRVAPRHFVQTPNRAFPIEPHFMFPFFQHLPLDVRARLLMHLNLAWSGKIATRERAREVAEAVQLMGRREFQRCFPESRVVPERILGLTKSFIAVGGW